MVLGLVCFTEIAFAEFGYATTDGEKVYSNNADGSQTIYTTDWNSLSWNTYQQPTYIRRQNFAYTPTRQRRTGFNVFNGWNQATQYRPSLGRRNRN